MSGVLKRFRKPTGADFIDTLWELRKYTLSRCVRFPKRYDRWVTNYLVMATANAHILAFKANDIRSDSNDVKEMGERVRLLLKARRELRSVWPHLEVAYGSFEFDTGEDNDHILVNVWFPMIDKAEALLDGIIEHDKKRYRQLLKRS